MDNFINLLEENNFEEALKVLQSNSDLLTQKSSDGWSVLQLAAYYNSPEIANYSLTHLNSEQINQDKTSVLLIAFEEKNKAVLEALAIHPDSNKLNWHVKAKGGNNLVSLAVHNDFDDLAFKIFEKGISCFEKNNHGTSAFTLTVEKGKEDLFDKFDQHQNLIENYDDVLIKKSIQYSRPNIFKRLHPYTNLSSDELFKLTNDFEDIQIMFAVLDSGDLIPGEKQITQIVELMCKKYEREEDKQAAKGLADYLFTIKIPFNKFVNQYGQSAWMLAIQNDNEEVFSRLLQSNETLNVSDTEQQTPLFYAIEKNNTAFVKALLRKRADPNQHDKNKNTPLIKAVERGNVEIVAEILKYCQMINEPNNQNEHALSIAIKKRNMPIVSQLIWAGGEITTNPVKFIEEKSIFHFGVDGSPDRFTYHDEHQIDNFIALSKLGFKLDEINEDGDSFLLHFIKNGYISNFQALLKCQVNPNQVDAKGNSALMCAAQKNQDFYFNSLLKRFPKIDFDKVNHNDENVYDICYKHNKVSMLKELVDFDDKIKLKNALIAASVILKDSKFIDYAPKLKAAGIDFSSYVDSHNNSALMLAVASGEIENFKYLFEHENIKVDLSHKNKNGKSLEELILALPEQLYIDFNSYLKKQLKNSKNP